MRSRTWVGSLFASCINKMFSFHQEVRIFIIDNLKQNSKEILWRIRVFNKNTNYSYIKLLRLQEATSCNLTYNILILLLISFIQFDKTFSKNCFLRLNPIESNQGASSTTHTCTSLPYSFDYSFSLKHDCMISCVWLF